MKVLTFHRLCILVALVLGLVCAWANAVPKVTSGDIFGGGCCCRSIDDYNCTMRNCMGAVNDCDMDGGSPNSLNCAVKPVNPDECDGSLCEDDFKERICQ